MEDLDKHTMYSYETVVIFRPTDCKESIQVIKDICQEFTGTRYKIKTEDLGVKALAYPLKDGKFKTGHYVIYTWQGLPDNVTELERCMRINDKVLKFMTVKRDSAEDELDEFVEDVTPEVKDVESEQSSYNPNSQVDALDVLLGFADYTRKVVS